MDAPMATTNSEQKTNLLDRVSRGPKSSKSAASGPDPREQWPNERRLLLVDSSNLIFRAFYAIRPLVNSKGFDTNAIFGFTQMILRLISDFQPKHMVAVFDSKEASFRKKLDANYKANRSAPPELLIPQFPWFERLMKSMEIPVAREPGYEADDLLATLTTQWKSLHSENSVVIVSSDKDLAQLIDARTTLFDTMKNAFMGPEEVVQKFGVEPSQIIDYLSLVGDSSDNIKGATGIGPKTASTLLGKFSTLEKLLFAAQNEPKQIGSKADKLLAETQQLQLAQQLVSLEHECPSIPTGENLEIHTRFDFSIRESWIQDLEELEFRKLLQEFQPPSSPPTQEPQASTSDPTSDSSTPITTAAAEPLPAVTPTPQKPEVQFRCICSENELQNYLSEIPPQAIVSLDTETTSLNVHSARLVGISLCWQPHEAVYIPLTHQESVPQIETATAVKILGRFQKNQQPRWIGQNLKYDYCILKNHGFLLENIFSDTMLESYAIDPTGRHSLDDLSRRLLGHETISYESLCGKGKDAILFDAVPIAAATQYAAEDAWCAWHLHQVLSPRVQSLGLQELCQTMDIALIPVLAEMELEGVRMDTRLLANLSAEFELEMRDLETKVRAYSQNPELNLLSPKQLQVFLFDELALPKGSKTKTGYSTDVDVLKGLAHLHEVPKLLLEYREIAKLKGTYIDPIPNMIHPKTGRLHTHYHQTGTVTGRLSSNEPNLQNIPIRTQRGRRIRKCFLPHEEGHVLLTADYSQIELRILAEMSKDEALCDSFRKGEDVHARTASELFGIDASDVTSEQRGIAKAINFGLMYGKTPFGLAQELGISRADAKAMIDRYFDRYSGVRDQLRNLVHTAHTTGFTTTMSGRQRPLPEIHSKNAAIRANAERMAMNTPIQGTAADMIKVAMIHIHAELKRLEKKSRMLMQVHDELVFTVPRAELTEVTQLVKRLMESALLFQVPIVVDAEAGPNWLDTEAV